MSSYAHRRGGRDPHDVLGVPRGADREQVVRAFHRKARRGGHPDTGGDAQTFEEIVRARDVLLNQARLAASESDGRAAQATRAPNATSPPAYSPRRGTGGLAVLTVVLALLGPFFWPVAIAIGHVALRQIRRTEQGGVTLVPVALFLLYVLTLLALLPILSLIVIQ